MPRKKPPTLAEQVSRGERARRELELTREAFQAVRQALLEAIAGTGMHDQQGRERLYLSLQVLPQVEAMLVTAVSDGEAAKFDAETRRIMSDGLN